MAVGICVVGFTFPINVLVLIHFLSVLDSQFAQHVSAITHAYSISQQLSLSLILFFVVKPDNIRICQVNKVVEVVVFV